MTTASGDPSDATTLTEVLDGYARDGYTASFTVGEEGGLTCGVCGRPSRASEVEMPSLRRLEGASDPADMSAVLALTCPRCGAKGTAVLRYGPEATPGDVEVLLGIEDVRSVGRPGDDADVPPDQPSHEG